MRYTFALVIVYLYDVYQEFSLVALLFGMFFFHCYGNCFYVYQQKPKAEKDNLNEYFQAFMDFISLT